MWCRVVGGGFGVVDVHERRRWVREGGESDDDDEGGGRGEFGYLGPRKGGGVLL